MCWSNVEKEKTHFSFSWSYVICDSRLSPQWLCGNSCTWAYDVRLHIASTNEPKSAWA